MSLLLLAAAVINIGTVYLPNTNLLVQAELLRLQPGVQAQSYEGQKTVSRGPQDVVVLYVDEEAPPRFRNHLAVADSRKRMIFVFMKQLERQGGSKTGGHAFSIALGRVLAHELEHMRRQSKDHDDYGWFRSHADRNWLTALDGADGRVPTSSVTTVKIN